MIKKRNLLICPVCTEQGVTHIMGELLPNGDVLIKRLHNTIRIRALYLQLICDQCGETVYIQQARPVLDPVVFIPSL